MSSDDAWRVDPWDIAGGPGDWASERVSGPLFESDGEDVINVESAPLWFDGSLAVVTGAAGPLGSAIARELSAAGAVVCLVGRDLAPLAAARSTIGTAMPAPVLVCDLADGDDVVGVTDFLSRLGRPVDVLVHAAGVQSPSSVATSPVELLDEHYLVNIRAPYLLTQQLVPLMRPGRGRCVFFSMSQPDEPNAHHRITGAGASMLASELRDELGASGLKVVEVETTSGQADAAAGDEERFADGLARAVLVALSDPDVDMTNVRVAPGGSRLLQTERR